MNMDILNKLHTMHVVTSKDAAVKLIDTTKTKKIVLNAFNVIKQAMIDDNPEDAGSYAHGWHCNIAMAVYDATPEDFSDAAAQEIGNIAATIFMKRCFDVDTKQ